MYIKHNNARKKKDKKKGVLEEFPLTDTRVGNFKRGTVEKWRRNAGGFGEEAKRKKREVINGQESRHIGKRK